MGPTIAAHFDTWNSEDIFGVWILAGAGRVVAGGKQEKREEIKSEPAQQEPSTPGNPTYLPKIAPGDGGLLTLGFSPAVLTSGQCSATNQPSLTLQQAWAGCI